MKAGVEDANARATHLVVGLLVLVFVFFLFPVRLLAGLGGKEEDVREVARPGFGLEGEYQCVFIWVVSWERVERCDRASIVRLGRREGHTLDTGAETGAAERAGAELRLSLQAKSLATAAIVCV